ncbi:hypothetical protein EIP91_010321 [Steccherinum ochraceum]|uniref:Enoyl reductase (ER) domain-containing protein n=1 Tax=Steccherinum ochraceum TaxID=92696 RepID=A0A4R0R3C4_9APHY|nr:hypothetical protein EIP91_010321 [Steccherinum ochraceum]
MSIPATMKAVLTTTNKTIAMKKIPVPTIDNYEVLVKVAANALNPTDWKHVRYGSTPDLICGVDYAGTIAKVGSAVTTFAVGDRVAGFVHGGQYADRGAFAEYVKTPTELTWKVPDNLTDEAAATLGCGAWTAVQTLYYPGYLGLVEPPAKTDKGEWVFIYGGSTSVGMYAIQFAHLSGYKVATVASPKHHDFLKSYGADVVVDYRASDAIAQLQAATNGSIHVGLDTIAEVETQSFSVKTFGSGPGKLITILNAQPDAQAIRSDVQIQASLLYTVLGRAWGTMPAQPDHRKHIAAFLKKFPDLFKSGTIKPNPTKLFEGGLNAVSEGFEYMIAGKNSGEKIVFKQ